MNFCKCGGMIVVKNGKTVCNSCGRAAEGAQAKITSSKKKEEVIVIEDNRPDLPETDVKCEKCDSMRAYWWLIQTRSADEPPTQFYKCVKCKHTWREYK